jgi:CheY-like chemotaxis protein
MSRVLLVNSDPVSLRAMHNVLRRAHYDMACAQTGEVGLMIASEVSPDIIVIDEELSDMSGLEVLRRLRRHHSRAVSILIVRFGHHFERAEPIKLGACDCVQESLSGELLRAVVHNAESRHVETLELEQSYAFVRWADVVVRGVRSPRDMPTLDSWARAVAVSRGTIRNWCYIANLSARRSLQFTRALRAVVLAQTSSMAPEDLLDIVDRRTLAKLMTLAGGTPTTLPKNVDQFFERQRIIVTPKAIAIARASLSLEGDDCNSHAEATTNIDGLNRPMKLAATETMTVNVKSAREGP